MADEKIPTEPDQEGEEVEEDADVGPVDLDDDDLDEDVLEQDDDFVAIDTEHAPNELPERVLTRLG